jgi:hypothetical protein
MAQAKRLKLTSRIPDSWNADGTVKESVTASAELDDGQREALTAAVGAMVERLGPVDAYGMAPQVFPPGALDFVDTLIELPDVGDVLTASGEVALPPAWYFDAPDVPAGVGHFVDGDRVFGRLAERGIPHIGMDVTSGWSSRSPTSRATGATSSDPWSWWRFRR